MKEKTAILEALIFASETPLTLERVAEIMPETEKKEIAPSSRSWSGSTKRGGAGSASRRSPAVISSGRDRIWPPGSGN